jgi:putative oxygen-independent coproporphyrinogen III oxidase
LAEDWRAGGFGIYIHWPFCAAKCPYCDFNSHVVAKIHEGRWLSAYLSEIRRTARQTGNREVASIFFGGGTPSLMRPETVGAIIDAARSEWQFAPDIEITLEANPTSVEAGRFRGYRAAGVNRLSLGVQALNDLDLKALGRLHTAAEAIAAFEIGRQIFDRISFDLIYARQYQGLAEWEAELRRAITIAADHLSLYQLTIEPNTRFGELATRNRLRGLPSADLAADMYELTQRILGEAGLHGYEISNHARPGAESRHNLVYWRYGDYAGIGPGAHGRLTLDGVRWATAGIPLPSQWIASVELNGTGTEVSDPLNAGIQAEEMAMMGLRLSEGIDLGRYLALAGAAIDEERLRQLAELGLIGTSDNRLMVSNKGRPVLNAVLDALLN